MIGNEAKFLFDIIPQEYLNINNFNNKKKTNKKVIKIILINNN